MEIWNHFASPKFRSDPLETFQRIHMTKKRRCANGPSHIEPPLQSQKGRALMSSLSRKRFQSIFLLKPIEILFGWIRTVDFLNRKPQTYMTYAIKYLSIFCDRKLPLKTAGVSSNRSILLKYSVHIARGTERHRAASSGGTARYM